MPARGTAGRLIWPLSVPPHSTWSTTDNNVPLEGGELTTSYASCRVRRDASRAVSRSKESYALVMTMRSQHLCIETKYTSSLGECEMTRSPKPRFRLDGTDTRRKSLVFKIYISSSVNAGEHGSVPLGTWQGK